MGTASSLDAIGPRIAEHVASAVGPRKYAMWFDRAAQFDYDAAGDRLFVNVPNRFVTLAKRTIGPPSRRRG